MKEYWIVNSNKGMIYLGRKDNKIWLGGNSSLIYIPIFKTREKAMRFRQRCQLYFKNNKELIEKYKPTRFYTERVVIK